MSGLLVAGEVVPGTEWVRRDPDAWWSPGERGTRKRAKVVDLLCGHWTGGEATTRSYDDDGPAVVRGMKARRRADGSPLNVGIAFVIGACGAEDDFAPVWQTADPGRIATVHVGRGDVNARSIGVEVVSAGMPGKFDVRDRPRARVELLGKVRDVLRFYPGQVRTWARLAGALASLEGHAGIAIPRRVPGFLGGRRMALRELRRWSGVIEHLHVPGTTKTDAAGMLCHALADAGWALASP